MTGEYVDVFLCASWRHVTTVEETVHTQLFDIVLLCKIDKSQQMIDVAVDPAIRQQTQQMQRRAVFLHVIDSLEKRFVFKERAILDRLCDHRKILIHYASGSDVEMADL